MKSAMSSRAIVRKSVGWWSARCPRSSGGRTAGALHLSSSAFKSSLHTTQHLRSKGYKYVLKWWECLQSSPLHHINTGLPSYTSSITTITRVKLYAWRLQVQTPNHWNPSGTYLPNMKTWKDCWQLHSKLHPDCGPMKLQDIQLMTSNCTESMAKLWEWTLSGVWICQSNCVKCKCSHIVLQIVSSLQAGVSQLIGSYLELRRQPVSHQNPNTMRVTRITTCHFKSRSGLLAVGTDLQLSVVHAVRVAAVKLGVVGHIQQLNYQVAGEQLCHKRMLKEQVCHNLWLQRPTETLLMVGGQIEEYWPPPPQGFWDQLIQCIDTVFCVISRSMFVDSP